MTRSTYIAAAVVLVTAMAIAIACQGPTPVPTPTATATQTPTTAAMATPTPLPTLWASAEAKECLLNPECSGLFAYSPGITSGNVVTKAAVLRSTEPARYWIGSITDGLGLSTIEAFCNSLTDAEEQALLERLKELDCIEYTRSVTQSYRNIVRNHIMPIIEEWTHRPWTEVTGPEPPPDGGSALEATLLRWYDHVPWHSPSPGCETDNVMGCTRKGVPIIVLHVDDIATGLHEAAHSLFYAEHTRGDGLMSLGTTELISPDSFILRPLDDEVYTLYGNPLLNHGMSKDLVEQIVQVRE